MVKHFPAATLMASPVLKFLLVLSAVFFSRSWAASSMASLSTHVTSIRSFCNSTPYPDACFDSLKLSISININPTILNILLQTLQNALSEAGKVTNLLHKAGNSNIVEKQRGAIQDCRDLHQITLSSLQRSVSRVRAGGSRNLADARTYLSAAMTNNGTCFEGLESASGPLKPTLVNALDSAYKHVSNSLAILSEQGPSRGQTNRRLMGFPKWLSRKDRRILQVAGDEYYPREVLTVAGDGTGNFTTITDAINFAPNYSSDKIIIYIREGVYEENVEIPSYKTSIVLLGDGVDVTIITGNRNAANGWTTFRTATLAVAGEGFLARDLAIVNSAGPEMQQAVALRVNADLTAFYRCGIDGFQDTFYVHSFRQFYRECIVSGTIDFIFGNAAAVLQACYITSKLPLPGQFTVITAQSRDSRYETTGISIQNCSIVASDELSSKSGTVKSYLGRPWRNCSRTVILESYIGDFIDPLGWTRWSSADENFKDTLYYGEYNNYGPGSGTDNRVTWPGYHVMDYYEAYNFTVVEFIAGDLWLGTTLFPYDAGI